jgi:hypothetical protein
MMARPPSFGESSSALNLGSSGVGLLRTLRALQYFRGDFTYARNGHRPNLAEAVISHSQDSLEGEPRTRTP